MCRAKLGIFIVALAFGACSGPTTKPPAAPATSTSTAGDQKLLGKWRVVTQTNALDVGTTVVFASGGELNMIFRRGNETHQRDAKYKIEGNRLSIDAGKYSTNNTVLFADDNNLTIEEIDNAGAVIGKMTLSREK